MSEFTELTVYTTHMGGDLVSDILWKYTDSGVVINDIEDVIQLSREGKTWDYADEKVFSADKTVLVKAYFPAEKAADAIKAVERDFESLKENSPFDLGSLECVKRKVDGDEWRERWKEHFRPIHIDKTVIVPEWIKYEPEKGEKVVYLDSNMAFGTGEHETTAMCVEFLQKYVKQGQTVLDVGCGSGILGITAEKWGAGKVIMTDLDPCATEASKHNVKLNKVNNCEVFLKNLLDDNTVKGDIIVANIMAEVLINFAPQIGKNLNAKGIIILSGILTDRIEKVKKAYIHAGFEFKEEKIKGEWAALVMQGK